MRSALQQQFQSILVWLRQIQISVNSHVVFTWPFADRVIRRTKWINSLGQNEVIIVSKAFKDPLTINSCTASFLTESTAWMDIRLRVKCVQIAVQGSHLPHLYVICINSFTPVVFTEIQRKAETENSRSPAPTISWQKCLYYRSFHVCSLFSTD